MGRFCRRVSQLFRWDPWVLSGARFPPGFQPRGCRGIGLTRRGSWGLHRPVDVVLGVAPSELLSAYPDSLANVRVALAPASSATETTKAHSYSPFLSSATTKTTQTTKPLLDSEEHQSATTT